MLRGRGRSERECPRQACQISSRECQGVLAHWQDQDSPAYLHTKRICHIFPEFPMLVSVVWRLWASSGTARIQMKVSTFCGCGSFFPDIEWARHEARDQGKTCDI